MSIVNELPATSQVAAVAANTRRRWFRVPRPRTADGWSVFLAALVTFGIPLWFWSSANTGYTPEGWVWSLPWMVAFIYYQIQMLFLLTSIGRSDDLGMRDSVVSGLSVLSVFGTVVIIGFTSIQGVSTVDGFGWTTLMAALFAVAGEFLSTLWVRFLVNRRYFATAPAADTGHHHQN
jgi:hypothetical protein